MPKYEALVGVAGILGLVSFSTLVQKIGKAKNSSEENQT